MLTRKLIAVMATVAALSSAASVTAVQMAGPVESANAQATAYRPGQTPTQVSTAPTPAERNQNEIMRALNDISARLGRVEASVSTNQRYLRNISSIQLATDGRRIGSVLLAVEGILKSWDD